MRGGSQTQTNLSLVLGYQEAGYGEKLTTGMWAIRSRQVMNLVLSKT